MTSRKKSQRYKPTESKYKGGAQEMYITYDREQKTRGGQTAMYPKVKRVYIAGDVTDWEAGHFTKQSGKEVFGVKIDYEQRREGYQRSGYTAHRKDTGAKYEVPPTEVKASVSEFTQIVELPEEAQNVQFHKKRLPAKYRDALQSVR